MKYYYEPDLADRTTIIIAHRLSTIRGADKIIVLDGGEVKEGGRHEELMEVDDGIYRNLVSTQLIKDQEPALPNDLDISNGWSLRYNLQPIHGRHDSTSSLLVPFYDITIIPAIARVSPLVLLIKIHVVKISTLVYTAGLDLMLLLALFKLLVCGFNST